MLFQFPKLLLHPEDADRHSEIAAYTQWKWLIAKALQPKKIVEIGVRAGYAMHAFMSAAPLDTQYIGYDCNFDEQPKLGGLWVDHAMMIAKESGYDNRVRIINKDTQNVAQLVEARGADFIHIDGEHTIDGVMHDLDISTLAWSREGVICIDDCSRFRAADFLVTSGVFYWLTRPNRYYKVLEIHSSNGDVLIFNGNAEKMTILPGHFPIKATGEVSLWATVDGKKRNHRELVAFQKSK